MESRIITTALLFGVSIHSAWASSDIDYCWPSWMLHNRCNNVPMLVPSNDSRLNLQLLMVAEKMADLEVTPPDQFYAAVGYGKVPFALLNSMESVSLSQPETAANVQPEEEDAALSGTRCVSNQSGKAAFLAALEASADLPAAEKQVLAEARQKFNPSCADLSASAGDTKDVKSSEVLTMDAAKITSPLGQQFAQYLTAAAAFYQGRYHEAGTIFRSLAESSQPWLKETALYMQGRVDLNRAQKDAFDMFGISDLAKVDMKAISSAEHEVQIYLQTYPAGHYAASARGLLRRVYWLSEQPQKLADEYDWLMNHQSAPQNNLTAKSLANEADGKILMAVSPAQVRNPILLAALDLLLMRPLPDKESGLTFADLQQQEPRFAGHKELHQYLLAAHYFYVQENPAEALKLLPETAPAAMTYLDFSRLMLRGLALEAGKDHLAARKLWLQMLPAAKQPLQSETVQLALALNYEQHKEVEEVFADNSPITDAAIRNRLLRHAASASLLRQVIAKSSSPQERHVALYTLLWKDLLQGHYQDYVQDHLLLTKELLATDIPANCEDCPSFLGVNNCSDNNLRLELFNWSGEKSEDSYDCPATPDFAKRLAKCGNPQSAAAPCCFCQSAQAGYCQKQLSPRAACGSLHLALEGFTARPLPRLCARSPAADQGTVGHGHSCELRRLPFISWCQQLF
ncbi:MAG: outer membrane assembly lipoprotein YfiO [Candidatus Electronema sp. V4]|uniref:outer membrane assembly lipoprotein YfiO n=1 Tax=Candidatus Electronema sp. V4 TaxID=3454756 RepID=UPI004055661F